MNNRVSESQKTYRLQLATKSHTGIVSFAHDLFSAGCSCHLIRLRNSLRVRSSLRNIPENADVVVTAFAFCTPLRVMQVCEASMTTATPSGLSVSWMQSRICTVRRSCTWRRRAYVSTTLAILLSPVMVPSGMYATCALPMNGITWCSHVEYSSMSLTRTICLYSSLNSALLRIAEPSCCMPPVRNCNAFATRSGVLSSPSRCGSSPKSLRISL